MKFVYLLVVCVLGMAAMVKAQQNKFQIPPADTTRNWPQVTGGGGGSRKQGFDVNLDVRQKVWESQNKRHSVDATAGYSQHLGGPYGNSPADRRFGAGYTYHFG